MLVETSLDDPRWHALVAASPSATPFHHPAWAGLLARCYGFRPLVLAEASGSELVAGVPLLDVKLMLRPRRRVGLPFTDELAVLAHSDDDRRLLVTHAVERHDGTRGPDLELRTALDPPARQSSDGATIHRLELRDRDQLLAAMDPSHRRSVRRASEGRLRVRRATTERDLTEVFYGLHVATRRRQGVPVQPRRYFSLLWNEMLNVGLGSLLLAEGPDGVVAGAVFLSWNGTLVYKYGASDPTALSERPNHLLFWDAIGRGVHDGCHTLDFGRTGAGLDGLATFKRRWGAIETPLRYSVVGSGSARHTERSVPRSAAAILRRSPPAVTRWAGTILYRQAA